MSAKVALYVTYGAFDGLYKGRGERRVMRMVPATTALDEAARIARRGKAVRITLASWTWVAS